MNLAEQLKRDEGVRRRVYVDSTGHLTIGVGHNLTEGVDIPLSDDSIDEILQTDIDHCTIMCEALPGWATLSEVRRAVLVNMCFNLGYAGLTKFTHTLQAIAMGDWDGAARAMLNSQWAKEVGARAMRLATQMRTDEWV